MIQQKAKFKQQKAAPKPAAKTTMAVLKSETENYFGTYVGRKVLTYNNLKNNRRKNNRQ